jgi:DNA-binding beta-propeller fold protein YncE
VISKSDRAGRRIKASFETSRHELRIFASVVECSHSPGFLPSGIALDSGGRFVYVANQGANSISAYQYFGTSPELLEATVNFRAAVYGRIAIGDQRNALGSHRVTQ